MDVLEAIRGRRSVRRLREGRIPDEHLRMSLEAAA